MKVAMYYTRPFETGGVEKTMFARGKYLSEHGYDVTFIFNSKDSPIEILEKWATIGDVKHVDMCDNENFDYCIYDAVYNLKKVKAKQYIQVINGNLIDSCERYDEVIPFSQYVAVSDQAKDQFKKLKGKDAVVIPNIIDEVEIKRLSQEPCEIPKAKYVFLTVSRLDPQKGFGRVEQVLKELERNNVDYFWLFVGSCYLYPEYGNQIKERFEKQYKCKFLGLQDNPYKYMSKVDRLIQLSDFESQCMVMFESLICGTPCMCTNFDTAKQTLTGDLGFTVKTDMSDFDINKLLIDKPCIDYHYKDYGEEWLKILPPIKKENYKFSIIIPNFNNAKWLDECLTSVLNQTYKNYELIFIDDMSTDNSLDIVKKYYLKFVDTCCGIKVLQVPYKKFNGGARNMGIIEATGDYIVCLDSDDHFKTNLTLQEINDNLCGEDVMFLGFELSDGKQEGICPFRPCYDTMYQAFINDVCAIWTKVVKTELLQDTLFPESTLAEDRVHHYRICDKAKTFTCLNKSTHVWNRANSTSVTTKRETMWEMSIYKHLGEMYFFIQTTKNEEYKKYVQDKFNRQWAQLSKNIYCQL